MLENGPGETTFTCEEGQALLRLSSAFSLPEKLGEQIYNVADRRIASDEVAELYRELKSRSAMLLKKDRKLLFGPADNYEEFGDGAQSIHRMKEPLMPVKVKLTEESLSGVVWCLLVALHPASAMCATVGLQEDIYWPIARKIQKVDALRAEMKVENGNARRWKSDKKKEASQAAPETVASAPTSEGGKQ